MTGTQITWDQEANVMYIRFSEDEIVSTIALSSTVYIDIDSAGNPIGMEILRVDSNILATLKNLPDSATLKDLVQHAA